MILKKQIAIVGGGIAGLSLAIALKKSGYECHVYEKNDAFREVGAAISMLPNALRVLQALSVLDDIYAVSGEMKHVFLRTQSGKTIADITPEYELPSLCLHRAELLRVLLSHAQKTCHLYVSHALDSIHMLPDGRSQLSFTNGQIAHADAVIGADGVHSVVRQYVKNDGAPLFRGYNIWRGISDYPFDGNGYASETYGLGKRFGIIPINEKTYAWWATHNEAFLQNDEPEGSKQRVMTLFSDWHYPIPNLVAETSGIIKNSLIDRKPSRGWSKNTWVLLGDAAHPTTPNLGQGGCIAIEGAWILAQCLKKYGLSKQAFTAYERAHYTHAADVNRTSLLIGYLGQLKNPVAAGLRDLMVNATPRWMNKKILDRFLARNVVKLSV